MATYTIAVGKRHKVEPRQIVGAIANEGGVSPFEGDPNYLPATTDWATVGQQVAQELSKAVTGQVSPEEAIRTAAGFIQ